MLTPDHLIDFPITQDGEFLPVHVMNGEQFARWPPPGELMIEPVPITPDELRSITVTELPVHRCKPESKTKRQNRLRRQRVEFKAEQERRRKQREREEAEQYAKDENLREEARQRHQEAKLVDHIVKVDRAVQVIESECSCNHPFIQFQTREDKFIKESRLLCAGCEAESGLGLGNAWQLAVRAWIQQFGEYDHTFKTFCRILC